MAKVIADALVRRFGCGPAGALWVAVGMAITNKKDDENAQ
jgi:hypothetical protein